MASRNTDISARDESGPICCHLPADFSMIKIETFAPEAPDKVFQ